MEQTTKRRSTLGIAAPLLAMGSEPDSNQVLDSSSDLDADTIAAPSQRWIQLQWLAMMGQFAPYLAHDICQPISSIYNYAGALKIGLSNAQLPIPKVLEAVDNINCEAVRANTLVKRLRHDGNPSSLEFSSSNVNDAILKSLEFSGGFLRSQRVAITTKLDESLPPINTDSVRLEQVLCNLLKNAAEAMHDLPSSERCIAITTRLTNGAVEVAVRDRGPSISSEVFESLTQPFFTTKSNAFGIGLWVCNSIMSQLGGVLEFHQTAPSGLEAVVRLPIKCGEES